MGNAELDQTLSSSKTGLAIREALINGVTIGLLEALWWISMLTLVFSGPLSQFIGSAAIFIVIGGVISSTIIAYRSSWRGSISVNQDVPVAILALVASQIVNRLEATIPLETIFITLLITVMIAALGTGLFMFVLGHFHLGNIVRFFPFPVLAGFLGGTGWLLLIGGITASLPSGNPTDILTLDAALYWIPAVGLAFAAYVVGERFPNPLSIPITLVFGVALFYAVSFGLGYTFSDLTEAGWLIGGLATSAEIQISTLPSLSDVPWGSILAESGSLVVLIVASTLSMMLNNSGFELTVDKEFDINHDLRVHGIANLTSGLFGGWPSYVTPSWSALNAKNRQQIPLTGLIFPIFAGILLLFATQLFDYVPRLLSGAMAAYLGIIFLIEWVVLPARRLPRLESAILVFILIAIAFFGLLEGVAAGLAMAILLFVINYSRINVWKPLMSGTHLHSRVTRVAEHRAYLRTIGEETQIMRLEGYLFFGSANTLLDKIRQLTDEGEVKALILDFKDVSGIDSTTLLSFSKLVKLVNRQEIELYMTALSPEMVHLLFEEENLDGAEQIKRFSEIDHALQTIEDKALEAAGFDPKAPIPGVAEQLQTILPDAANIPQLLELLEQQALPDGAVLMSAGAPADSMYFVIDGFVTAQLDRPNGKVIRLETMGAGRAVGEIGFYLNQERTASVVSSGPSEVYRLTKERLDWIEQHHPDVASTLHRLIVNLLSDRVTHLVGIVDALQR